MTWAKNVLEPCSYARLPNDTTFQKTWKLVTIIKHRRGGQLAHCCRPPHWGSVSPTAEGSVTCSIETDWRQWGLCGWCGPRLEPLCEAWSPSSCRAPPWCHHYKVSIRLHASCPEDCCDCTLLFWRHRKPEVRVSNILELSTVRVHPALCVFIASGNDSWAPRRWALKAAFSWRHWAVAGPLAVLSLLITTKLGSFVRCSVSHPGEGGHGQRWGCQY